MKNSNNYLKRLNELYALLKKNKNVEILCFETNPPVSQKDIDIFELNIGHPLHEDFLIYFRESNGVKLIYQIQNPKDGKSNIKHGIIMPDLLSVMDRQITCFSVPNENQILLLGGRDDFEFRQHLFLIDAIDGENQDPINYGVYYNTKENVVIFSGNYEALIDESHPMTMRSYIDLCLASGGIVYRRDVINRGLSRNYRLLDFSVNDFCIIKPLKDLLKLNEANMQSYFRQLKADLYISVSQENYLFLKALIKKSKIVKSAVEDIFIYDTNYNWQKLGGVLVDNNYYDDAVYIYNELLKIQPNHYYGLINLGITYYYMNDFENAEKAYLNAIKHYPMKDNIWYRLGTLYFEYGHKEKGYKALEKAIALNPSETQNYPMIAYYAIHFGDYEKSIPLTEEGIRRGNATNSYLNKALAHLIKGEKDEAVQSFYYSYLAFEDKDDFWSDFKSDYSVLPQYNVPKGEYMALKNSIEKLISNGITSIQAYAAYWSRGLNVSTDLFDENLRQIFKDMGYPKDFLEWLYWGNHTYCVEVLAGDIHNFTQEIFSTKKIEEHNARPENQLLLQNGFLIFGSLSGAEYDIFDTNNNNAVCAIRKNDYFEKLPTIEEVYKILSLSDVQKEFDKNPSLKFEDKAQKKLIIKSPYIKDYIYNYLLIDGTKYDGFIQFIEAQTNYIINQLSLRG